MDRAAKDTVQYYDQLADRYDRQYRAYLSHTHQKLLDKLELSSADKILDCSSGTGLLAQEMIDQFGPFERLVLNDPAPKMRERAKYRLRYNDNIEFTGNYSEELSFDQHSFTQIICLNSFHYYTDQDRVLQNFKKMLKPGGTLWMLDWDRTGAFVIANKLIDWLSTENINTRNLEELRAMMLNHQFNVVDQQRWRFRWWNFQFMRCEQI